MKIGLFFGSFNPIHIGHLILANHVQQFTDLEEVWFVVTPQSPFKQDKKMPSNEIRLEMVNVAIKDFPNLKASDIEFSLPQPNYTVNTMKKLTEKFPENQFSIIMGEDNLNSLHKWKEYEFLLQNFEILIYPRLSESQENPEIDEKYYKKIDAPIIEISSTFIRENLAQKKDIRPMLPTNVFSQITKNQLYI